MIEHASWGDNGTSTLRSLHSLQWQLYHRRYVRINAGITQGAVSLASWQPWRCTDAVAWCKRALIWIYPKDTWRHNTGALYNQVVLTSWVVRTRPVVVAVDRPVLRSRLYRGCYHLCYWCCRRRRYHHLFHCNGDKIFGKMYSSFSCTCPYTDL